MIEQRIAGKTIVAVAVATAAALIFRTWLQVTLTRAGTDTRLAADLSYLLVPPIMALLLAPLWRTERSFIIEQFRRIDLSRRLLLQALLVGVLLRLIWWSQLVAGVAFGVYGGSTSGAPMGATFGFRCDSPEELGLGFLVTVLLTPTIEELVNRGYFLSFLRPRGPLIAILVSAAVFAVLHNSASWPFAFLAGLVLGYLYWATRSLWSCLTAHATFNALTLFDWRCLSVQWNPSANTLPVMTPGATAIATLIASTVALAVVLHRMARMRSPPAR
jgi:membrane protease YdiL (CAAX protease family)